GEHRRGSRQTTEEQVAGDVGFLPRGGLDDLAAVVGLELGVRDHGLLAARAHERLPAKTATPTPANATAAAPTLRQIDPRSRVVTTGSGGRPYTSGSSRSRKNAPSPPTPSSGSRPYSRATSTPLSCSSASRWSARSRSSSSSPNWIDSVGHAWA